MLAKGSKIHEYYDLFPVLKTAQGSKFLFFYIRNLRKKKHTHVGTPGRSETSFAVLHILLAKF